MPRMSLHVNYIYATAAQQILKKSPKIHGEINFFFCLGYKTKIK